MRNADRFDLANLDVSTIDPPASGERSLRDSVVSALALRLRSGGSRTWIVLRTKDGKTVREMLGDATSMPLASARLLASGPVHTTPPVEENTELSEASFQPAATVGTMLPRFLAFGANGRWKPSTGRQMESVARTCILPLLGDRKVLDITPQDVACWHRDVTAQTSSARMALSTLSGLMLFAEDHGLRPAGSNPCRGLRKKAKGRRPGSAWHAPRSYPNADRRPAAEAWAFRAAP